MPQISFTKNNEQVYARFSRLLLEEQLKRGKLTAPQFLDLVLDGFEKLNQATVINFSPDMELSDFVKNVVRAAVDDVADAEANDPGLIEPQNETK